MMTGRDLIVYILENGLEDKPIYEDGNILGFMNEVEAAIKFGVGAPTIRAWYAMGMLDGVFVSNALYIPVNAQLSVKNGDNDD